MSADGDIQILKDDKGKPTFVVVPWARWQMMTNADAEGAFLAKRYKKARARKDIEVPWEFGKRIAAGENAIKIYRERGLTQETLAQKIAGALSVPVSALIED